MSRPLVIASLMVAGLGAAPAVAATLQVGPDAALKTPSAAAAVARDGDTVTIAPGEYFDCAIWRASDLTIMGAGPAIGGGVVLTDKPCEGKASFVTRGSRIVLRNLTFTRIRVPDGNGAGIRAEGGDLTIERSRFVNDQVGILANDAPGSTLIVRDSEFTGNGIAGSDAGTADILAGARDLLRIETTQFDDGRGGAAISSGARRTELAGNRFVSHGPAPYIIGALTGGALTMDDNAVTLAAGSAVRIAAIAAAADGDQPAGEIALRRTVLVNQTGAPAILLRNWGGTTPVLQGNTLTPGDTEATASGATLHAIKVAAHAAIAWAHAMLALARHMAAVTVHWAQRAIA